MSTFLAKSSWLINVVIVSFLSTMFAGNLALQSFVYIINYVCTALRPDPVQPITQQTA